MMSYEEYIGDSDVLGSYLSSLDHTLRDGPYRLRKNQRRFARMFDRNPKDNILWRSDRQCGTTTMLAGLICYSSDMGKRVAVVGDDFDKELQRRTFGVENVDFIKSVSKTYGKKYDLMICDNTTLREAPNIYEHILLSNPRVIAVQSGAFPVVLPNVSFHQVLVTGWFSAGLDPKRMLSNENFVGDEMFRQSLAIGLNELREAQDNV